MLKKSILIIVSLGLSWSLTKLNQEEAFAGDT